MDLNVNWKDYVWIVSWECVIWLFASDHCTAYTFLRVNFFSSNAQSGSFQQFFCSFFFSQYLPIFQFIMHLNGWESPTTELMPNQRICVSIILTQYEMKNFAIVFSWFFHIFFLSSSLSLSLLFHSLYSFPGPKCYCMYSIKNSMGCHTYPCFSSKTNIFISLLVWMNGIHVNKWKIFSISQT